MSLRTWLLIVQTAVVCLLWWVVRSGLPYFWSWKNAAFVFGVALLCVVSEQRGEVKHR